MNIATGKNICGNQRPFTNIGSHIENAAYLEILENSKYSDFTVFLHIEINVTCGTAKCIATVNEKIDETAPLIIAKWSAQQFAAS
jgi:hypothetical protein